MSTKIFLILFFLTLVPAIILSTYIFRDLTFLGGELFFEFTPYSISGLVLCGLNAILGTILYIKFLRILKISKVLFFTMTPLTLIYGVSIFIVADLGKLPVDTALAVQVALKITTGEIYTSILWSVLFTLIYLILSFFIFAYVCRPIQKIEKTAARLGDGKLKEDKVSIGKSRQFKKIENALEKINFNYKENENIIKQTNIETQKFIPKQVLKFLGKSSVTELELGNQVQKRATTLFCDLISSTTISKTLSLEENFNFINSYLNIIAPLVRKYDGFIDQYLGDGILAVFSRPERAVECAHSIIRTINVKNKSHNNAPSIESKIAINTGEIIFGVVGEEERKSIAVISDVVNLASKMEDINKFLGTSVLISKETLNELPAKFEFAYRHVGSLAVENQKSLHLFESLEVYKKTKREKLSKLKNKFENGVRFFNNGQLENAKAIFSEILKFVSDDKVSYVYYNKVIEKIKHQ